MKNYYHRSLLHRLIAQLSDDLHFNDFENLKYRIINCLE